MKSKLAIALCAVALGLTGCASIDKYIPAITAESIDYTRTGKFSSTTVRAEGLVTDATKVKADKVTIQHSNAWIPNVAIQLVGYERTK